MPRRHANRGRSRSRSRGGRSRYPDVLESRLSYAQHGRQAHHSRFGYEPPMGRMRGFGTNVSQTAKVSCLLRGVLLAGATFAGSGAAYLAAQQLQISTFFVTTFTGGAAPVNVLCPDLWRVLENWKSFNVTGMKLVGWVPPEYTPAAGSYVSAGRAWSYGEVNMTANNGPATGSFFMIDTSSTVAGLPNAMPTYQGSGASFANEESACLDPTYRREKIPSQTFVTGRNERQFFKRYLKIPYTCVKGRGMNTIPISNWVQTAANAVPPILTSTGTAVTQLPASASPCITQNEAFISYIADLSGLTSLAPSSQSIPVIWKSTLYLTTYGRWDKQWSMVPSWMRPTPELIAVSGTTFGQTMPLTPIAAGTPTVP